MLDRAKARLLRIIDALREPVHAGASIVVLEPSCASVFRDEMPNLLAGNDDARRLSERVMLFSEFLDRHGYRAPRLERRAVIHGHCHHKARSWAWTRR